MNELASLGVILLLALLAGHIVKWLRVPEVTGYILTGIALGPSLLGWISVDNLSALQVLSEVALGLILFSIGTVFEFGKIQRIGKQLAIITVLEALAVFLFVAGGMLLIGQPPSVSIILGTMAIETAAASTLMVLREANAQGPLTEILSGVFALDNLFCLFLFNIVVAVIENQKHNTSGFTGEALEGIVLSLLWQLVGSAALGYVIGYLLSAWSTRVVEHGERLILLAGCVLLCVGVAKRFELSPLVANLAVGATVVNLSERSRRLFASLSQTDPPLYAIFFVLAGAELNLSLLQKVGISGLVYVGGRIIGKYTGAGIGTRLAKVELPVQRWLGSSMLAQAGLAVGLSLTVSYRLPEIAPTVVTIVLSAVLVFEIIGPLAVRFALLRTGEAKPELDVSEGLLD